MYNVEVIGQERNKQFIDRLIAIQQFPHFFIILGEEGSGKRTLTEYIADKMGVYIHKVEELKVDNIRQMIADTQTMSEKRIFLIAGAEQLTNQAQNALLKIAEEPPENAFIILTCCDKIKLLPTILSRGTEIEMAPYTQEQLEEYSSSDILCNICNNIGEIVDLEYTPFKKMMDFAELIKGNIGKVSIGNALKIAQRVDFGTGRQEFDLNLLLRGLFYVYKEDYEMLRILSKYKSLFARKGLNKKALFDMMLLDMREV